MVKTKLDDDDEKKVKAKTSKILGLEWWIWLILGVGLILIIGLGVWFASGESGCNIDSWTSIGYFKPNGSNYTCQNFVGGRKYSITSDKFERLSGQCKLDQKLGCFFCDTSFQDYVCH